MKNEVLVIDFTKDLTINSSSKNADFLYSILHDFTIIKTPKLCNKDELEWSTYGIQYQGNDNGCTFNNSSVRDYPAQPLNIPGGIVNNVDINPFSWLWDPDRGHIV